MDSRVLLQYLRAAGGPVLLVCMLLGAAGQFGGMIAGDFWLAAWVRAEKWVPTQPSVTNVSATLYSRLSLCSPTGFHLQVATQRCGRATVPVGTQSHLRSASAATLASPCAPSYASPVVSNTVSIIQSRILAHHCFENHWSTFATVVASFKTKGN